MGGVDRSTHESTLAFGSLRSSKGLPRAAPGRPFRGLQCCIDRFFQCVATLRPRFLQIPRERLIERAVLGGGFLDQRVSACDYIDHSLVRNPNKTTMARTIGNWESVSD